MNLKSFTIASMLLAAGLCATDTLAAVHNTAALKETSSRPQISLGNLKPNPGYKRVAAGQLQWTQSASELSGSNALVHSNPLSPKVSSTRTRRMAKAPAASAENMPILMGCVCYADSWNITGEGRVGIYEISPDALGEVSLHEDMLTSYGQVYAGSKYFATQPEIYYGWVIDMQYNIYDTADWSESKVPGNYNFNARAMTFDPVSRRAYAITKDDIDISYHLAVMDMDTYAYTVIGKLGTQDWSAIMCSPEGELYGIKKDGMLVKFDKSSARYSEIASTGLASSKMTCGTIDAASGRCYYIHYTDDLSDMYEIDLTTGTATFLYSLPETAQVLSLFVPEKATEGAAPAKATGLELAFAANAFAGEFMFHIPETTHDGSILEGAVAYSAMVNGKEVATGQGNPGDDISCAIEIPASGEYTFSVVLSNGSGSNEPAAISSWIGYPAPAAPKNVVLSTEADKLILHWDTVEVADAEEGAVTYTVVAYPGGEIVAEGLTVTSYSCDIPATDEFTKFSYGVYACYGDSRSAETVSNNYVAGYLSLPFSEDFEDASCMDLFTIVNANDDSHTWEYNFFGEGRLLIQYTLASAHDDWAILHPVKLESGKQYTIGFDAKGTPMYTEKIELAVARATDADALKAAQVILPEQTLTDDIYRTYTAKFIPEESGIYYIGFHATSDPDQNKLFLDNVTISAGVSTLAPGKVEKATADADPAGALSAVISFIAPTLGMDGNPLAELSYVAIERDGNEIGRVEGKPGERLSFTDNAAANGDNTYTLVGYNSYGRGSESTITVYVGVTEPESVANVTIRYGSNTGEAEISWTAPEYDSMGHNIAGKEITYNVLRSINGSTLHEIATGITETSYIDQVMDPTANQKFVNYFIEAVNIGGISERTISNFYPFGRPEQTPVRESFGGRTTVYEWGSENPEDSFTAWDIFPANEMPFPSYDNGAMAAAYCAYNTNNNTSTLISSLFDLSGLDTPVLSFYLFDYLDSENILKVYVDNGKTCEPVTDIAFGEADMQWKRKSVDLSAYKDQTVCIKIETRLVDYSIVAIDNLRIGNDVDHNLAAISITAPESAEANEEFTINALIENAGKLTAEAYKINLLCDGEVLKSIDGENLEAEAIESVAFAVTLPVVAPEKPAFSVEIEYSLDQDAADNVSDEAIVKFIAPSYPAPENVAAEISGDEVVLTWTEPDLSKAVLTATVDDIESYVPFSTGLGSSVIDGDNIGEWTTIDADGLSTYTGTFSYPGVGEPMAFVVYNSHMQEDNVFGCHSGQQMFLSLASRPNGSQGNDDWLISPELAGCAQTISFYAKSIDTYGVDDFQVLYSTTGKEIEDFTLITETQTTGDWKEYSFDLPEDARFFAVRCVSYDRYAFLLDDFRMITAGNGDTELSIEGYNVYCDGKRVNESLIAETTYTHLPEAKDGDVLRYNVACAYNAGESKPSETVEVQFVTTGIEKTVAAAMTVIGRRGELIVKGAEGRLVITDTLGRIVYDNAADGDVRVSLPAGIYMVNASKSSIKTIVR